MRRGNDFRMPGRLLAPHRPLQLPTSGSHDITCMIALVTSFVGTPLPFLSACKHSLNSNSPILSLLLLSFTYIKTCTRRYICVHIYSYRPWYLILTRQEFLSSISFILYGPICRWRLQRYIFLANKYFLWSQY